MFGSLRRSISVRGGAGRHVHRGHESSGREDPLGHQLAGRDHLQELELLRREGLMKEWTRKGMRFGVPASRGPRTIFLDARGNRVEVTRVDATYKRGVQNVAVCDFVGYAGDADLWNVEALAAGGPAGPPLFPGASDEERVVLSRMLADGRLYEWALAGMLYGVIVDDGSETRMFEDAHGGAVAVTHVRTEFTPGTENVPLLRELV